MLCASQSGRCLAAYAYAAAGTGESTIDLAWDGHGVIYDNGQMLAGTERFATGGQMIVADVDIERLVQELVDLRREISHTDSPRFRDMLYQLDAMLQRLLPQLPHTLPNER